MIELTNINKSFNVGTVNESTLFSDFNITFKDKDFVSIVGSNGSGKTTLLNIIGGALAIDSGKIIIDGADVTSLPEFKRAKRIGRVFQNPSVGTVPGMSILENLAIAENKGKAYSLSLAIDKSKRDYYKSVVADIGLGLEDKMDIPVGLLSGGQRQALSLIMNTLTPVDLLLLDEHTAALDPKTAEIIMQLTDKVIKEKNLTALMVTHNLRYAVEYGNRIIMMHEGNTVIDKSNEDKKMLSIDNLLTTFNEISIECGN